MGLNRDQSGFTLIELMVVVAIIGILSSIAIPNFERFLANGRKSEAKLTLATIYSRQEIFRTEFGNYTTCLKLNLGYIPEGYNGTTFPGYYRHGFKQNGISPTGAPTCTAGEGHTFFTPSGYVAQSNPLWGIPEAYACTDCCTDCFGGGGTNTPLSFSALDLGAKTYTIQAEGSVGGGYKGQNKNIWTINQQKLLMERR